MIFDRINYKAAAKEQLKGNVWMIFLCSIIVGAIIGAIEFIPIAGAIAAVVLAPVLYMGMYYLFMDVQSGKKPEVATIFKGFSADFGRIWLLFFLMGLYTLLWSLLFFIPGIVKSYAYSMAPYILAENPDMTANEAITRSKEITMGHKGDLFVMDLSFIGWGLLITITFGLVGIYAGPYMALTKVNAYHALKGNAPTAQIYDAPAEEPAEKPELSDHE